MEELSASPWKLISTVEKIEDKLILLACADWTVAQVYGEEAPRRLGAWHDGSWYIFGASWEPTHWCEIPEAPPLQPRVIEEKPPLLDGCDICYVMMSPDCESGLGKPPLEIWQALGNVVGILRKLGDGEIDENAQIKMCAQCRPIFDQQTVF